jgi:hypothetical protein
LTGQQLPPRLPATAAAAVAGEISVEHATVIRRAIHALPLALRAEHTQPMDAALAEIARTHPPRIVAAAARRYRDWIDPDGQLLDEAEHDRRRHAVLLAHPDGSGELHARLTAEALATWHAVLDPLAAPRPCDDTGPDLRSAGQRTHDALLDAAHRLLAGDDLPASGGTPATVLITLTADQLTAMTQQAMTQQAMTDHAMTDHAMTQHALADGATAPDQPPAATGPPSRRARSAPATAKACPSAKHCAWPGKPACCPS